MKVFAKLFAFFGRHFFPFFVHIPFAMMMASAVATHTTQ
jgi:hypothetical protein